MPINQPLSSTPPTVEKKLWVIVPAAGSSERFTHSLPPTTLAESQTIPNKLLLPLPTGRLVLQEVIYRLGCVPCVAGIVVLTPDGGATEHFGELLANPLQPLIPATKRLLLTTGGATRRATVLAGLEAIALADPNAHWVAVQDAARPLVDGAWLEEAFNQLQQMATDGIVGLCAGTKVQDTVKACALQPPATLPRTDALGQIRPVGFMPVIANTVDRTPLWQVQTPQLFSRSVLCQAHQSVDPSVVATDDAQLIELAGLGGVIIKQSASGNFKLTTWADYQLLENLLRRF